MIVNDLRDTLNRSKVKKPTERLVGNVDMIVVHTTDWDTSIDTLVKYDIGPNHISSSGCPTITYHDVIMKDGTVNHCEYYKNITWHAGKWNLKSIAVAMMYKCTDPGKVDLSPAAEQFESLKKLLVSQCLCLKIRPQDIYGHRELEDTGWVWKLDRDGGKAAKSLLKTCPGMSIDLFALRKDITARLQSKLKLDGFYTGSLDGNFGPKSFEALKAWKPKVK